MLLGLFESAAVANLGEVARFTTEEKKLIEPALSRMLQRLPAAAAGAVSAWLDPLFLATGLLYWGGRQVEAYRRRKAGEPWEPQLARGTTGPSAPPASAPSPSAPVSGVTPPPPASGGPAGPVGAVPPPDAVRRAFEEAEFDGF